MCTTQANICVKPGADVELILDNTVAELILCKFDRALVTLSFFCFPRRFNLSATSYSKALVSMKICPFDSFMGVICRKVCFAHFVEVTWVFGRLVQ